MEDRTPKNLQELLRYAIKVQQDDVSNTGALSDNVPIDEDKKQFLNQVLQSMTVNVMEEFLKAIAVLQQDSSSDQDKMDALEIIRDYIDNIDFANSLIKIEDADIIIKSVKHSNHDICISAIKVIAEMSQNNMTCQKYFLQHGIVELLTTNYLNDDDPELVASAMYAISALTQHFEPSLTVFMKNDGLKKVVKCLSSDSPRVIFKACSLISSMSSEFNLVKDEFAQLGVFTMLSKRIRVVDKYDMEIEMMLEVMSVIIESRHCNLSEEDNKYITDILTNIVKTDENLPECEEIAEFAKSILSHLDSKN